MKQFINKLFYWEDEIIIRLKGGRQGAFGLAPLFSPLRTMKGVLANGHIFSISDKMRIARFMLNGIVLAADYTKQRYLATMEGAVYSGRLAANLILKASG